MVQRASVTLVLQHSSATSALLPPFFSSDYAVCLNPSKISVQRTNTRLGLSCRALHGKPANAWHAPGKECETRARSKAWRLGRSQERCGKRGQAAGERRGARARLSPTTQTFTTCLFSVGVFFPPRPWGVIVLQTVLQTLEKKIALPDRW